MSLEMMLFRKNTNGGSFPVVKAMYGFPSPSSQTSLDVTYNAEAGDYLIMQITTRDTYDQIMSPDPTFSTDGWTKRGTTARASNTTNGIPTAFNFVYAKLINTNETNTTITLYRAMRFAVMIWVIDGSSTNGQIVTEFSTDNKYPDIVLPGSPKNYLVLYSLGLGTMSATADITTFPTEDNNLFIKSGSGIVSMGMASCSLKVSTNNVIGETILNRSSGSDVARTLVLYPN